ncbi:MAG: hypothetical protein AMJ61_12790 [Desulfobacterales bacterium SG8_35_2]|jgi:hypothetical protein|nr:MAG: hypothetical protein AMJ61_12790 [Desulfobacterales bacterium SG8_35_2]
MKKFPKWRIIYAVCCLVYMGWIIHVGSNEFDRINGQHRRLVEQLDAGRIRDGVLEELSAECRGASGRRSGLEKDDCLSWPSHVVEAKAKEIKKRRIQAKERGTIKLVLFYTGFVLFFLLGPPVLVYLLLLGILTLYKNIKIVR